MVAAVRSGELTLEQACRRYQLSEEEFRSWERAFDIYGLHGLRTTRTQQYRPLGLAEAGAAARKRPAKRQPQPSAVF